MNPIKGPVSVEPGEIPMTRFGNLATKKSRRGILIRLARLFLRDKSGISAIEAAFVFPVMVAVYLGGTAATQGIVIKRKVTLATRTIGDLVSQDTGVSDAERDAIFTAGRAMMQPYSNANAMTLTVTSLSIDDKGIAKVEWSDRYAEGENKPGRTVGDVVPLPDGINEANTHVILAEGSYTYTPPVGQRYFSTIPLKETFYLRPRHTDSVKRCANDPCPPPAS